MCGLEIDAVGNDDGEPPSVELTFRVKQSEDGPWGEICGGLLPGYTLWSEAPLALLLRSLHMLRVQWFRSIPAVLLEHPVRDLSVSVIHLTRNGLSGPEIASFTLKKVGYEQDYSLVQTLPNRALFPMSIDADSASPLGAALKSVSQVQLEAVDLHTFPEPAPVSVLTDEAGRRHLLREQLPHFALTAFDAYNAAFASNHEDSAASLRSESLVPADEWACFLAA
jgi:hypothetical protein